ncbi:uncharacterized protein TNCV_1085861 [Trichonephila clavipes]|nr:uncharacterized protein TNCV_1085861 [Trichonephila clavipes]
MSKWYRNCNTSKSSEKSKHVKKHQCSCNHQGSAGSMEPVGAYGLFERSRETRKLEYVEFYGDGDSKSHLVVKDIYGIDNVRKYECIGHIQKRVGSKLRILKTKEKGLGGKGKLSDSFIDKIQNYYGIAIRSNIATRRLLVTDHALLNHGQVAWTTPELAPPLSKLPHHTNGGTFKPSTDLTCIAALHGGSLVVLARTHDMFAMNRYLDHWTTAVVVAKPEYSINV